MCDNPRPCTIKECRFNLVEFDDPKTTCLLDCIHNGGLSDRQIAELTGTNRDVIRYIEKSGKRKMARPEYGLNLFVR